MYHKYCYHDQGFYQLLQTNVCALCSTYDCNAYGWTWTRYVFGLSVYISWSDKHKKIFHTWNLMHCVLSTKKNVRDKIMNSQLFIKKRYSKKKLKYAHCWSRYYKGTPIGGGIFPGPQSVSNSRQMMMNNDKTNKEKKFNNRYRVDINIFYRFLYLMPFWSFIIRDIQMVKDGESVFYLNGRWLSKKRFGGFERKAPQTKTK